MKNIHALQELMDLRDQIDDLAQQAKSIVKESFPDEFSWCRAYGIFRMTDSDNPYDNTFEKLIENIERRYQEED